MNIPDVDKEKNNPLRRILPLPTLVAFFIAGSFLLFLLFSLDIDLPDVGNQLADINFLWYGIGFLLYYFSFFLRGLRWHMILKNVEAQRGWDTAQIPSVSTCSQFILLTWFTNTITWFRLGEAYRPYLVTESTGASFSRTAGTVLAERALDLVLIFMLLILAALLTTVTQELGPFTSILGIGLTLVFLAITALLAMRHLGLHISRFLPHRLLQPYDHFRQGALLATRQLPMISMLGLTIWFCEIARLFFVIQSLGLSLPLSLVVLVSMSHTLLSTIPITPGGLGIVEPGMVGLLVLQLGRPEAVAVVLLDRTVTYLSVVVIGGVLFVARESRKYLRETGKPTSPTNSLSHSTNQISDRE